MAGAFMLGIPILGGLVGGTVLQVVMRMNELSMLQRIEVAHILGLRWCAIHDVAYVLLDIVRCKPCHRVSHAPTTDGASRRAPSYFEL